MLILELIMIVSVILLNIKIIFHAVLPINWYVLMINLVKMLYYTEEKMLYLNLFKVFLMNILL